MTQGIVREVLVLIQGRLKKKGHDRIFSVKKRSNSWRDGNEMKSITKSKLAKVAVAVSVLSLLVGTTAAANAATKTITCYNGTAVKKVTAAKPKCAAGWSTKKPVATAKPSSTAKPAASASAKPSSAPSTAASTPVKSSGGSVAFNGTYKGKIAMVWSESDVRATSVTGSGSGTVLGLDELTGTGSSSPQSQCDLFDGTGTLSGEGNTLKVVFDAKAKACAADGDAPTTITISKQTAEIKGGTGKFAGATGTLEVTGTFKISSKDAGTSESNAISLTLSGNIVTK